MTQVFSADTEPDHILPSGKSLDDSYMNKVICFTEENRKKSDRTPIDTWGQDREKWNQIKQSANKWEPYVRKWDKSDKLANSGFKWDAFLKPKVDRFFQTESDLQKRDFISSQLNDTRYISRVAIDYVKQLGCEVSVTKGFVVSELRHQWGFNKLINKSDQKDRTDHRHHAIDAVVIAATSRSLYQKAVAQLSHGKLKVNPPYATIRGDLANKLKPIIVSHTPQRKLSGSLHEDTGASYIKKHGGLVYRKKLNDPQLKPKKIVDETVKKIVLEHMAKYDSPKEAFADGVSVFHKDGKTPIKRVRVLQSKVNITKKQSAEDRLQQIKFGVKNKQGEVFKWMVYGNTHHVEVIRHKKTGRIKGEFVTMMLASHRAKGINMPKQPIVKVNHGDDYEFLMVLHKNDTVSMENEGGERIFYRVKKLNTKGNSVQFILGTAATDKAEQPFGFTIDKVSFDKHKARLHNINAIGGIVSTIGHLIDD